jgi:hypothetical protein
MNRLATSLPCLFAAACLVMMSTMQSTAQTAPTEAMAEHAHTPAPLSTSLTLTIDGTATKLSIAELQAMPQTTVTVHNEHTKLDETYSGVPLADLLAKYGLPADQAHHHTTLHSYIVAAGTDKYWVVYSVAEVEPTAHNAQVIVATSIGSKPLGEDGQLKLIDSADKKPQRWVRNLTAITVKSAD